MPVDKIWILKSPSPDASILAREAGVSLLQAQLLINRGISEREAARSFLTPRLSDLADPMALKGMDDAVVTIVRAVEDGKRISVFGDYDADGLTAAALLVHFFTSLNIPVSYYIPNRLTEGYGLNRKAIEQIAAQGNGLIITVDCGISDGEMISFASKLGLRVVVTDHHQIPKGFQPCWPAIDPHRRDCSFPFKNLAGVGLAFYLAVALRAAFREKGWFKSSTEPDLRSYLDLVALGTVADNLPLLGENRILADSGLKAMARSQWPGINALKEVAQITRQKVTAQDVAFRLAPRLNAPGRLGSAQLGMQVLTAGHSSVARDLAIKLDAANMERQNLERSILSEIESHFSRLEGLGERRTLFIAREGWHRGVLGILASKLVDRFHRPSFVIDVQDGMAVGSARSIEGFNLHNALHTLRHLFDKFGGHAHAAGFTLKAERLEILEEKLEELAVRLLQEEDLRPTIEVDAFISLHDLTLEAVAQIEALSPFGAGNPEPLFVSHGLEVMDSNVVGDRHLKLQLRQRGKEFEAIGFGLAEKHPLSGKIISMVFHPRVNCWGGYKKIQLRIVDLEPNRKPTQLFLEDLSGKVNIFGREYEEGFLSTGKR